MLICITSLEYSVAARTALALVMIVDVLIFRITNILLFPGH